MELLTGNKLAKWERKGLPPYGLKERELIILAMGPSRGQCPFDAEVWGLNMGHQQIAEMHGYLNKLFMAHTQIENKQTGKTYFNWDEYREMAKNGIELINIHKVKGVPFKMYPFKRISEKFGTDYFTDTICYMIAYALDKSTIKVDNHLVLKKNAYTKLRLYGVDMQQKDEYQFEKPGIEFWLGIAKGLGIEYTISQGSALLDTVTGIPYGKKIPMANIDPLGLVKGKPGDLIPSSGRVISIESTEIVLQ